MQATVTAAIVETIVIDMVFFMFGEKKQKGEGFDDRNSLPTVQWVENIQF